MRIPILRKSIPFSTKAVLLTGKFSPKNVSVLNLTNETKILSIIRANKREMKKLNSNFEIFQSVVLSSSA